MTSGPLPAEPVAPLDATDASTDHSLDTVEPTQAVESRERLDARRSRARWLLPLLAIAVGLAISALLLATQPAPDKAAPEVLPPSVRTLVATPQDLRLSVAAHGTVTPRTESNLVAEVRGRIVSVSRSLVAGGFFAEGDLLLRLDRREHQIAVDRARAQVDLALSEERLASAEAKRRRALLDRGASSTADLEQFESRAQVAAATVAAARASLAQAELDLERTAVRAPFDGRVRTRDADVGQFVNPGEKLAEIFAVDYAEVRLPIRTDELSHLVLALGVDVGTEDADAAASAPVVLSARLGGRELRWPARLVRTEGEIDPRTRMLHVVARVDDPYARSSDAPPLPAGLFVRGEIQGRELHDVFALPTSALRDGETVYVVDGEDRLLRRPVEVLRRTPDEIVIGRGLHGGERVILSPLRVVTDGMLVKPVPADAVPARRPAPDGDGGRAPDASAASEGEAAS